MGQFYAWIRARLIIIIFAAILVFQYLNWRATQDLARYLPGSPPSCDFHHPCFVKILP